MEWLAAVGTAFALVAPVELPDKTFVATLVLATRYPQLPVWLGVTAAFAQCAIAVTAGGLLALLPQRPVQLVAAAVFGAGAAILFRGARRADAAEAEAEHEYGARIVDARHGWRAAATSFAVLLTAEWGDLSQLLTAGLVASGRPPSAVYLGSWLALAGVAGAAVLLGRLVLAKVRLAVVRYLAAGVCGLLAVITLVGALT